LSFQNADSVDAVELQAGVDALNKQGEAVGSDAKPRVVVRLAGALDIVAKQLRGLVSIGISEVVVEVDWPTDDGPRRTVERLRNAV
jgi:hypothetical protein